MADAQGAEVVENRARAARLGAHVDHVMHGQAGFEGGFGLGGVDLEVAVEAEISQDAEAEGGIRIGDGLETVEVHASSWESRLCRNTALSLCAYRIVPPMREKLLQKRR